MTHGFYIAAAWIFATTLLAGLTWVSWQQYQRSRDA
jgi:hypothetical protein